jgi:hypothetical protein
MGTDDNHVGSDTPGGPGDLFEWYWAAHDGGRGGDAGVSRARLQAA